METVCGRSASRSGRGGVRSGRAVVGLDVVSHTLPRNYRTKTYHHHHPPPPPAPPCCPSPHDPCHDQGLPDPTCAHCQPDLCPGDPSLRCAQVKPYPSHGYPPQVVTSGWENVGVAGECATCRGMVAPPLSCACSDPCCLGSYATTPVWDPASHHDQRQALAPHHDLQVVRASSVCVLPQVRSVEERLTSALGHALDPQNRAHTHDNIYTHSNAHGKTHAAATSSTTISHSNASTQPKTHHSAPQIHHLQPTGPRYPPSEIEAQQPQCTTTETYVHSHQSSPHVHSMTTRAFVHVRGNDEDHWNEKRPRLSHTHRPNTYTADLQKNQGQGPGAPAGSRLSRSVENLPRDIQEHILKCQCSCDHLGYGNYSAPSLHHLPGVTSKGSSQDGGNSREDLPVQEVTELKNKHKGEVTERENSHKDEVFSKWLCRKGH
ncbi:uncharacterized protein [Panulirus ornatus]|uniref:uncharacterized protein n=1 Tax=Panulirus ornatus TaxID=150431 RepID=UPI003A871D75